ncbi:pyruvate kinase [Clostridium sp. CAG:793]|nr:pyruvate kinase [Clostridium sp. CAG:793]
MKDFRKTKIIGTIGPASESEEMLTKLMNAGLNVCRINFSHGGYEENAEKIATIKRVRKNLNVPISMALDTKGPEIRTGKLESGDEKVTITEGQEFTFVHDDIIGNNTKATLSYKELYKDVKPGSTILVDDGAIEFRVKEVIGQDILCVAQNTGRLGSRKTMNIPDAIVELPALGEKDIKDITNGVKAGFDYIFASFVRRADDVRQIRKLLDDNGGQHIGIISKIESQEGIDKFEEILAESDGIMVARGDMGVEIPFYQVPIVQKHIIKRCNEVGKPVITATQMLESMTSNPRPTRAEVSDVANAVYDLTGCIMLSGECAMGKYPVECVTDMDKISKAIEGDLHYWKRFDARGNTFDKDDLKGNIAYTSCVTAKEVNADAIVAYTHSGETAYLLSGCRPACPIIAITDDEKTYHKLALAQNVLPVYVEGGANIDETIGKGIAMLEKEGTLEKGDKVVIAGGDKILANEKESQVLGGIMRI